MKLLEGRLFATRASTIPMVKTVKNAQKDFIRIKTNSLKQQITVNHVTATQGGEQTKDAKTMVIALVNLVMLEKSNCLENTSLNLTFVKNIIFTVTLLLQRVNSTKARLD